MVDNKDMCKVITSGYCPYADGVDEDVKSCADCPWYNPEAEQRFFEEVTRMADREKVFDAIRNCVTEPKCKDKNCPWKEDCEKIGCKRTTVPVTLLLDTLNLLKEQPQWISVKDRLPKENKYVLAVFANGDMVVACVFERDEDAVYWRAQTDMGWECDMDFDPIYWMPLPEPPEGVKQDETD